MKSQEVEKTLADAFGINVEEIIESDPGAAHNFMEEWGATVNKVSKLVNRLGVRAHSAYAKAPKAKRDKGEKDNSDDHGARRAEAAMEASEKAA